MRLETAEQIEAQSKPDTVRRCALTRAHRSRDELIRFVQGPDGTVVPDLKEKLHGRGVWLTAARDVVEEAVRRKAFGRALKAEVKVPEELPGLIDRLLVESALGSLAIANKAGEVVFGHAKVEDAIARGRVLALVHAKEAAEVGCRKLDGRARAAAGTPVSTIRTFGADELGLASGRTNVIHAALIQGGATGRFLAAASRVERYREGSAAFKSQNGSDTDKE
ncbi:MAG: RNA-binding protein [Methyloceanibacter sp.]